VIDGRLRVPESVKSGEPFEVRVLILHPMETGFRRDAGGREIPTHIVNHVACTYGGREVFSVDLGTGISANPYLVFFVRAGGSGELKVEWIDDKGERGGASANVNVA
jgi:thiosulfate oxidation carrier complex protein SoxZ